MKKNIILEMVLVLSVAYIPFVVVAQQWDDICVDSSGQLYSCPPSGTSGAGIAGGTGNVIKLISFLQDALNIATRLILAAAVVYFLWGVFQYVKSAGNEEARETGKNHIIYGVIGIAVMVSLWGLVNFLTGSANLDITTQGISVPELLEMPN